MFQMMQAIAFMHKHGFFHRDIKPENTLIKAREKKQITGCLQQAREECAVSRYNAQEMLLR